MSLLPVAEIWRIGDDFDRERAVREASSDELHALIHAFDHVSDQELEEWLTGPQAESECPSPEYVAITNLLMARDSAKLRALRALRGA